MRWNWQCKDWPNFNYNSQSYQKIEAEFLHKSGVFYGVFKHIDDKDKEYLLVDLLSDEALKTSEIEGEYLNRNSLQSSIRKNFGLLSDNRKVSPAEQGISALMKELYENYQLELTHKQLFRWHKMLMNSRYDLDKVGAYRNHPEPMQVVSSNYNNHVIHFEAPPSERMYDEMNNYINWFNNSATEGTHPLTVLTRASIAHLYFVSIHPFEDGNGRIARALTEKCISQYFGKPTLLSLSTIIEQNKKDYYDLLKESNKTLEITEWIVYFSKTIIEAQNYTQKKVNFIIEKTKLFDKLRNKLNQRQEKVILRIFHEGVSGFKGGLSAENYISITGTSRATATRDLKDMVKKGAFKRSGDLKYARYWLNIKF